jgi:heptosyltransferase-2
LEGDALRRVAVVAGESDAAALRAFGEGWSERVWLVPPVDLITVAALARVIPRMVGHDSGISHIAAAAGARCLLLFGPTDPGLWAPLSPRVRVCRAESGDLLDLSVRQILRELEEWFEF